MTPTSHRRFFPPGTKLPPECRISMRRMVDNCTLQTCRAEVDSHVQREIRTQLAEFIASSRVRRDMGAWETTYSLDLYVFTPDEFHQIMEHEVERRLALRTGA